MDRQKTVNRIFNLKYRVELPQMSILYVKNKLFVLANNNHVKKPIPEFFQKIGQNREKHREKIIFYCFLNS